MNSPASIGAIASGLLETANLSLISCISIQSLWAGYGHICRVEAQSKILDNDETCQSDARPESFILKYVSPPITNKKKAVDCNEGHVRKVLSYQVEQFFYTRLASQMPADIPVASCLVSVNSAASDENTTAMLLSDLRESFPVPGEKRASLSPQQTRTALKWLADFHGFWWIRTADVDRSTCVLPPKEHYRIHGDEVLRYGGVWLNGGYTYLATRHTEFEYLLADSHSEWASLLGGTSLPGQLNIAEQVSMFLSPSRNDGQQFITLIHGDVKSENLFTNIEGNKVAFYDFQYVGLGYGVSDLAKFFTCSVPVEMLTADTHHTGPPEELTQQYGEEILLKAYLDSLQKRSGKVYKWETFVRHWETALVDWLRFQASWGFWGNTEWLEARVRYIVKDDAWRDWLMRELNLHPKQ